MASPIALLCLLGIAAAGLTPTDIQTILTTHLTLRSTYTPAAANMMNITWSNTLAFKAKLLQETQTCNSKADFSSPCTDNCLWDVSPKSSATGTVAGLLASWAAEGPSGPDAWEMLRASHYAVGCDRSACADGSQIVTCFYADNLDAATYNSTAAIPGLPCSQCATAESQAQSLYQCTAANLCYLPSLTPALAHRQALLVQMPDKASAGIRFGGANDDTPVTVSTGLMLELWGINVTVTNDPARVPALLQQSPYDFLVLPGSNHDVTSDMPGLLDAHGGAYRAAVRDYVAAGGHYVGICYGAFAASDKFFDLLPGMRPARVGFDEDANKHDQLVPVQMPGGSAQPPGGVVLLQEGPTLSPSWATKKAYGTYTDKPKSQKGQPVAAVSVYRNGTVGLIGPHFEAGPRWYGKAYGNDNTFTYPGYHHYMSIEPFFELVLTYA